MSEAMNVLKQSIDTIVRGIDAISDLEKAAAGDPRKAAKLEELLEPVKREIINAGVAAAIVLGGSLIRIADALDEIANSHRPASLLDVAKPNDLGVRFEDDTSKPARERM